jgi:hypothetical protein
MAEPDVNALYNEFSGKATAAPTPGVDVDALHKEFYGNSDNTPAPEPEPPGTSLNTPAANRESFVRGISDVLDTGMHGLGAVHEYIADKFLPADYAKSVRDENAELNAADLKKRQEYEQTNPNAQGMDIGRLTGQVVGSAPLAPVKAIQLWKGVVGALPTVTSAGAKVAAPLINRLAGFVGEGAAGGATYGAATASASDKSTVENIGQGLITGAIAGPVIHAAGEAALGTVPALQAMWARVSASKIAQEAGLDANVVRNVLGRLSDAGYTPQEAQAALNKLGPKATLMDLDNSLTTEGSGLASLGGKPTAILKNSMEARSLTANNDVVQAINQKLGPKPDMEAEKEAIIKQAQKETKPDYQAAHNSGAVLDISDVSKGIDDAAKNAVGQKKSALLSMKGWLYKEGPKDAEGNPTRVLKDSVPELHEIRQAIDDELNKRSGAEGYGANAARSINNIRSGIDEELKTVPEMKAADIKFATKMDIAHGLQTGYDAIAKKTSKEEFARTWNAATPEVKETIRKGMRAAIGDYVDSAQRGELTGAQQLLGNKSVNRANLRMAFGLNADQALDALQKEAAFRTTEGAIRHGSQTAERQAVQARYGERAKGNTITDIVHGAVADITTGSPALGTGVMMARRFGSKAINVISGNRLGRLVEGTADVLSQQGGNIQRTLDTVDKVGKIQGKIIARPQNKLKLPVTAAAPIGETVYAKRKQLGQ